MGGLTIVGAIYVERCIQPLWNAVYGSGGRAAAAVAQLVPGETKLVSYVAELLRKDAESLAAMSGFKLVAEPAPKAIVFDYLHPLSTPSIHPPLHDLPRLAPIRVIGDVVLRYGMLEGDAVIEAAIAVYDPQSAFGARRFGENGSKAGRLAVVLNRAEAADMTGHHDPHAAAAQLISDGAEVVVVKMGSHGALVITRDGETLVPAYRTERVWKIGSGDVFSATFAALWACRGMPPAEAAHAASRAVAQYSETRSLPVMEPAALAALPYQPVSAGRGTIYLAAPFFDIGQRWLVEEVRMVLRGLGATVFSPCHEVGPGPANVVAPRDIEGLDRADVLFAVLNGLDPGTIFEVGYAVRRGIPVVALAQNVKEEDLKMVVGTGCDVVDDLATAAYRAVWRLPPA